MPRNQGSPVNADRALFGQKAPRDEQTISLSSTSTLHYKTVVEAALSRGACLAGVRVTDTNIEAGLSCGLEALSTVLHMQTGRCSIFVGV